MYDSDGLDSTLAHALRRARRALGYTIADLAAKAEVSPRLISEFERGERPHVSLATAMRLLHLVGVELRVEEATELAQTQRAEHRRRTWVGVKTTLRSQSDPVPPVSAEARLAAVAQASRLAVGLQQESPLRTSTSSYPIVTSDEKV